MIMSAYQYRITVDMLEHPTGEGGLQSLSFFASTPNDILAAANSLQDRFDCSASHATKLAVGLSLISELTHEHRSKTLLAPLQESMRQFIASLNTIATETVA
jgi:hypothetical protein